MDTCKYWKERINRTTIQHELWVTIITRHACRWFTETHHCAQQLCVHGLWVEVHFCTQQQDALQGTKGYSLQICLDTEGELNMWMTMWDAQQTLDQLLNTEGYTRDLDLWYHYWWKVARLPKVPLHLQGHWCKPLSIMGPNYWWPDQLF